MKVAAVTCARLGSTRLPRKVLAPLCGRTLLQHTMDFSAALGLPLHVFTQDAEIMQHVGPRCPIIYEPDEYLREGITYETMQYCNRVLDADHLVLLQPTQPVRCLAMCRAWLQRVVATGLPYTRVVHTGGHDTGLMYTYSRGHLAAPQRPFDFVWAGPWFDIDTEADLVRCRAWLEGRVQI